MTEHIDQKPERLLQVPFGDVVLHVLLDVSDQGTKLGGGIVRPPLGLELQRTGCSADESFVVHQARRIDVGAYSLPRA